MDGYPKNLAPQFEPGGAPSTPFEEWWKKNRTAFPTIPEEVARYWLYEHWGHSPYAELRSADYQFERVTINSDWLPKILSRWCNFDIAQVECEGHGAHLSTLASKQFGYKTAQYMLAYGEFPTPIIVLDNRNGHLDSDVFGDVPNSLILIEGHRRFNLALHLRKIGRLKSDVAIWMMRNLKPAIIASE